MISTRILYSTFLKIKQNGKIVASSGFILGSAGMLKVFETPDEVASPTSIKALEDYKKLDTGMGRLKFMFSKDEAGNYTPELSMVNEVARMSFFVGAFLGGTIQSRESYLQFFEKNQATAFHNHLDAKKRLQDRVTLGFMKGAWKWGWRLALFTGGMSLFTTCISVYRGKSSLIEYTGGVGITGMLYKARQGPKAMVSGLVIGSMLGTVAGVFILSIMYITGIDMDEMRYWRYKWEQDLGDKRLDKLREIREKELDPLFAGHEESNAVDIVDMLDNSKTENAQISELNKVTTVETTQERKLEVQQGDAK